MSESSSPIKESLPASVKTSAFIALKLAVVYAAFSGLYILLSDQLLYFLFADPAIITFVSTIKGWIFVFLTSVMLYFFVRSQVQVALEASRLQQEVQEEKRRTEERIHHLAYFDGLTELPNRVLLTDRLAQIIVQSMPEKMQSALILLNVDRFKKINDARGQGSGDSLLKALSLRLRAVIRDGDTLARVGGDEFAILLHSLNSNPQSASHTARIVANKVQQALNIPVVIDDNEVRVTVSMGLTLFPDASDDSADEVIKRADNALHKAKNKGGNQALFFESEMGIAAEQYFQIERELRKGIDQGELQLYLQSQVDAHGKVMGAEALVRWLHPERGLVLPAMFIPVAEDTDLIADIDKWVFEQVCLLLASAAMCERSLRIAVNISPRHFRRSNFVNWIKSTIAKTGVDAGKLTLEITEGLLVDSVSDAIAKMSELTALGIHFSIDDFGTGYSSLSYLKRLPIHELKIDKVFVQDAPANTEDAALVETILAVAKHLRLRVVAEGVETQAQADFLNERAVVTHQGYLYSKPEPAGRWLENQLLS